MQRSIANTYDKIALYYTKQNGYDEQLSIPSLKKFLSLLPPRADVLDVGCGGGQDSKFLTENDCAVLGVDVSKEMIKLASNYSPKSKFAIANVMDLSLSKGFDGIWCCRVFHHISLKEQGNFITKLNSLLKPDGILYITSVVSDTENDYEAFDSGNNNLLKKRLSEESFKNLILNYNFKILVFNYWEGKKGMEIFARKITTGS